MKVSIKKVICIVMTLLMLFSTLSGTVSVFALDANTPVSLNGTSFKQGEAVYADFYSSGNGSEWVGLYYANATPASGTAIAWAYPAVLSSGANIACYTTWEMIDDNANADINDVDPFYYQDFNEVWHLSTGEYKFIYFSDGGYTSYDESKVAYFTVTSEESDNPYDPGISYTPSLKVNKNSFCVGEDILVTATGSGSAWIGIYLKDDFPRDGNSFYWYNVNGSSGNGVSSTSGATYDIQDKVVGGGSDGAFSAAEGLAAGDYTIRYFADCGYEDVIFTENITIKPHGEITQSGIDKASFKNDGAVKGVCKDCGAETVKEVIGKVTMELESDSYEYTGFAIEAKVIVKDAKGNVIDPENYTVEYKNNKEISTDTVYAVATVTFKSSCERYQGSHSLKYFISEKHTHEFTRDVITNASFSKEGKIEKACKNCSAIDSTKTVVIPAIVTVALEKNGYIYTGKEIKPVVTVKDADGNEFIKGEDFVVSYANNTKAGTATVTVTLVGANYEGTKELEFTIGALELDKSEYELGEAVKLTFLSPGYEDEWIGLYYKSAAIGEGAPAITWSHTASMTTGMDIANYEEWTVLESGEMYNGDAFSYKAEDGTWHLLPGEYKAVIFADGGYTAVQSVSFKVKEKELRKDVAVTTDKATYSENDTINLTVTNGTTKDSVAVYKNGGKTAVKKVMLSEDGKVNISAKYFEDGTYTAYVLQENVEEFVVAASEAFTVKRSSALNKTLKTDKTEYCGAQQIKVTAVGSGKDWVGIYNTTDVPGRYETGAQQAYYWYYANGWSNDGKLFYGVGDEVVINSEANLDARENFEHGTFAPGSYKVILFEHDGFTELARVDIQIVGHSFEELSRTESTCTVKGSVDYKCTVCGYVEKQELDFAQHSWDKGRLKSNATCEKDYVMSYACTVCGAVEDIEIPYSAIGHDYKLVETQEGTCLVPGFKKYLCSNPGCEQPEKVETVTAGHEYVEKVIIEPTCTKKGLKKDVCKWCSVEKNSTGTEIPTLNHKDENGDKSCDTCGEYIPSVIETGNRGVNGDNVIYTFYDDGTLVFSGKGDMVKDYGTVQPLFDFRDDVKTVIIEDGITSVGNCVLMGCKNLKKAVIPDSVTNIDIGAFNSCEELEDITVPANLKSIGKSAFSDCRKLKDFELPESVESIGARAFYGCKSLIEINIPEGVEVIGKNTFYSCSNLKKITLPDSLTAIGEAAFGCNSKLSELIIPENVKEIGEYAFYSCSALEKVNIPFGVTRINDNTFESCSNLKSITIPDSVIDIGKDVFAYCSSIENIVLGNGIKVLASKMFYGCSSVVELVIPETVEGIQNFAFDGCSSLSSLRILNPDCKIFDSYYAIPSTVTIYGHEGSKAEEYSKKYNRRFVSFENECFHSDTTEYEATWNDDCAVDDYTAGVFCNDCGEWITGHKLIEKTHIDKGNDCICDECDQEKCHKDYDENNSCDYCGKLLKERILIESGNCGPYDYETFDYGSNVKFELYSDGLLRISGSGPMADFEWYSEMPDNPYANYYFDEDWYNGKTTIFDETVTELIVEEGVTHIGKNAFYNFIEIGNISLPKSLKSIGDYAFSLFSHSGDFAIPENVEHIGDFAFAYIHLGGTLIIPGSVKTMGVNAFWRGSIEGLIISEGVEMIGARAFSHFDSLPGNIVIPSSVKYIGENAFVECGANVYIYNTECEFGNGHCFDDDNILYGYRNSTTQAYAEKYGYTFIPIDAECSHTNTEEKPAVPSTCTEKGYTAGIYCNDCEEWISGHEEIGKTGHNWTNATCTTVKTCTLCGATEGSVRGHLWLDATCKAPSTCTFCGATQGGLADHTWEAATCTHPKHCTWCYETEGEPIPHSWVEATCTAIKHCSVCGTGVGDFAHKWNDVTCTTPKTCSLCGETRGNALGHSWNDVTCTTPKTCARCGATEGSALGHDWNEATCKAAKTCSRCGATEGEALGHKWQEYSYTEPRCIYPGEEVHKCTVCGEFRHKKIDPLGHNIVTVPAVEATCTSYGYTEGRKCSRCNYYITGCDELPFAPHTEITIPGKAPACMEMGLTEGKMCTVCGEMTVAQKEINALGHSIKKIPGKPSTCTEMGYSESSVCTVCGEVELGSYKLPLAEHDYSVVITQPTCTADGYTTFACKSCSYSYVGYVSEAIGHIEVECTLMKMPTCTEEGTTSGRKCKLCGIVFEEPVISPKTEHNAVALDRKEPTCTETGLTGYEKCMFCNTVLSQQTEIPANGHSPLNHMAVSPTCTETGLTEGADCTVCGAVIKAQETIPAKGHTEVVIPAVPATYTKSGKTEGKECSSCGEILVAQKKVSRKKLNKVTSLKVKKTTSSDVTLSWKKITGADSYKVYYSTNGKKWKSVKVTKNSATIKKLSSAKNYQFKVRAFAGKYYGEASKVVKATTKFTTATLSKVTSAKKKQASVNWKKTKNASGYVVEYSTSKNFTKKTTKTVTVKNGKTTKTTLKKLKSGKKYYVRVKAYKTVNKKAVYGEYSKVKTVKVK